MLYPLSYGTSVWRQGASLAWFPGLPEGLPDGGAQQDASNPPVLLNA